jgi:hypothetical protein
VLLLLVVVVAVVMVALVCRRAKERWEWSLRCRYCRDRLQVVVVVAVLQLTNCQRLMSPLWLAHCWRRRRWRLQHQQWQQEQKNSTGLS